MSDAQTLQFVPTLPPEDQARADLYALLARLFYAPPDGNLLSELLRADAPHADAGEHTAQGAEFASAWAELVDACRSAFPAIVEHEHTALFVGVGKAEVTPYLSHYVLRHESDNPLVELRKFLEQAGLARQPEVPEYEDHVASVLETMRFLIAVQRTPLAEQRMFFDRFLVRGVTAFCDDVSASPYANFYRIVARLAKCFLQIERDAFDMGD